MRYLALLFTLLIYTLCCAEDIIVLKDGEIIKSCVIEINQSEVKYKRASNPNGPTYSIAKNDVLAITYSNGEKETFSKEDFNKAPSNTPRYFEAIPSRNNDSLISLYNSSTLKHKKKLPDDTKVKLTDNVILNLGITPWSILSDENVEISLVLNDTWFEKGERWGNKIYLGSSVYYYNYRIEITNKTNSNIFIDNSNSFRINLQNQADPFYNGVAITNSSNSNTGGSLGLGAITNALGIGGAIGTLANGVSVGKSNGTVSSITEAEDRVLIVPPHSTVIMPQKVYVNENKTKALKNFETFIFPDISNHSKVEKWAYTPLGEEYINIYYKFLITYSKFASFDEYTTLSFGVYPRGLLGVGGVDATTNFKNFIWDKKPAMIGDYYRINRKK